MTPSQIVYPLGRHIWEPSASRVVVVLPLLSVLLEVTSNTLILPCRAIKIIGKATRREISCYFGSDPGSGTYTRHVGARCGKRRHKLWLFRAIVRLARHTGADVARSHDNGDATGTKLSKNVTDLLGVCLGEKLLVGAVRDGDHLGQRVVVEIQEVAGEFEIWLERVALCIR